MSFPLPQSLSCLLKTAFPGCLCVMGEKNNGFEGNGEVGERSCGEQLRYRVPGLTLQAAAGAGGEEQTLPSAPRLDSSHPCSPQGSRQLFPCLPLQPQGRGSCGLGFPTSAAPPPQHFGTACTSCLVGWPGRLLNGSLFMGFSSARHANHLIP